jgi:hypothetical protein
MLRETVDESRRVFAAVSEDNIADKAGVAMLGGALESDALLTDNCGSAYVNRDGGTDCGSVNGGGGCRMCCMCKIDSSGKQEAGKLSSSLSRMQ